ncbi:MAG: tol-pal system protein YbgF [Acidobacteria bacterium]|nr:tol-pal system protein YbgF [Acidobacteriota bacterium]
MIRRSTTLCSIVLGASGILAAQNQKDMIIQMQRDMGLLQEQVRTMQRTQDEKFAGITENLRTTLDVVNRLTATLAVTQKDLNDKLGEITRNVSSPMTSMGGKVDSMADQFQGLSNSVADLNSRIGKLDARVAELQKMLQVIQAPPTAPPAGDGGSGSAAASVNPGGAGNPTSLASAQKIFDDANRDMLAGSFDLALQGFQDYLKNYGNTQQAADAQFYIGEVYFRRDDFDSAVKEYTKVMDSYPDSSRVADAHFKKGMALVKLGRRTDAKKEFQTVVDKFPGNPLVARSKDYLKALGVNTTQAPAPRKSTTRKR